MSRDTAQLALGIIVCASVTVLAHAVLLFDSTTTTYKQGYWIWAIIWSTTSIVACGFAWLALNQAFDVEKAMVIFIFLTLLWSVATSVMTFRTPFHEEGNGYFACFVALLTSWFATMEFMPAVKEYFEKFARGGSFLIPLLFIASGTVLIQSALKCSNVDYFPEADCLSQRGWIQACPVIAFCLSLLLLIPPVGRRIAPHFKYLACFLYVNWAAGAYVGTFVGPYTSPMEADGYFGCWAAYAACIFLLDGSLSWNAVQSEQTASLIAGTHAELLVLFSSSICVFVAGSILCYNSMIDCFHYTALSVYSGVSSGFLATSVLVLRFLQIKPDKVDWLMQFVASFLLAGWIGAFGCMTYRLPFPTTGNGFYGSWMSFLASVLLFTRYVAPFRRFKEYTCANNTLDILTLWGASILLVVQLSVDQQAFLTIPYGSEWIWGIVICVSTMLCLIALQLNVLIKEAVAIIALLLLAGWAATAGVLTFKYPYTNPGNGYFATWIGFLGAARFFRLNFFQIFDRCQAKQEIVYVQAPQVEPVKEELQVEEPPKPLREVEV
jgi:hypothetical protein